MGGMTMIEDKLARHYQAEALPSGHPVREAIDELRRLRTERDDLTDTLHRHGFRRCDVPACACGQFHHRFGLPERMSEIKDALAAAGHEVSNENGNLPLGALASLVAERDAWREQLWALARVLNCLPSTAVDGNAHVYRAAEKAMAKEQK